jgi:hypothetical protein
MSENEDDCSTTSGDSSTTTPEVEFTGPATSSVASTKALPKSLARFAANEPPLKDQICSLMERERNILALLRHHWDTDHQPMPGHLYLRFAQYCQFNLVNGRKLLSTFDERYLKLTATQLEPQLLKEVSKLFLNHDIYISVQHKRII